MTKKLIVLRHAKSDWNIPISDFERPLNERGRTDAPKMGLFLNSATYIPQIILTSDAARTYSTASLVAKNMDLPNTLIQPNSVLYLADYKAILRLVSNIDDTINTLMVVGHNPGLSDFVSYLIEDQIELKTCCAVVLDLKVNHWNELFAGTCTLFEYISPRNL